MELILFSALSTLMTPTCTKSSTLTCLEKKDTTNTFTNMLLALLQSYFCLTVSHNFLFSQPPKEPPLRKSSSGLWNVRNATLLLKSLLETK
jgi:hypothetical protein